MEPTRDSILVSIYCITQSAAVSTQVMGICTMDDSMDPNSFGSPRPVPYMGNLFNSHITSSRLSTQIRVFMEPLNTNGLVPSRALGSAATANAHIVSGSVELSEPPSTDAVLRLYIPVGSRHSIFVPLPIFLNENVTLDRNGMVSMGGS